MHWKKFFGKPCKPSVDSRQDNYRNDAGGFPSIFGKAGHGCGHLVIQACSLGFRRDCDAGLKLFGADLNSDKWIGDEVVVPVGIGWGSPLGGNYHKSIAIFGVGHWIDARLLALRARRMQKEQSPPGKWATNLALICPKLLDDRLIPFVWITHNYFLSTHKLAILKYEL
jgi:hypothetical protein